jgi:hypothetical protein
MNKDIKAEAAQSESVQVEEEKLAEVTGGARVIDVSRQFEAVRLERFSTLKIADRISRLNVADLFGGGSRLPLESLQAGNTDWQ